MFFQVFWFTGKSFFGYEDIGEGQGQKPATHVMMFMVTALNMRWKLPIAYFLYFHTVFLARSEPICCALETQTIKQILIAGLEVTRYKGDCSRNPYCT